MNTKSRILIVGHHDIVDNSLRDYFQSQGYENVISSADIALDTTIQSSVYHFFSENRPEYVFLTSTRSGGIQANIEQPAEFIYHNLESQNNVIYAARKFQTKKLLFLASSCVYPKVCVQPMKEDLILTGKMEETSEPYSIAKAAGIKMCQAYKKQYGLNAIVMIPATVFGPGADVDLTRSHVAGALIAKFAEAVKQGKSEIDVWGSGKPRREFLYVDDFVDACLYLMKNYEGEEVVNVGIGQDFSIVELAEKIAKIAGFKGTIKYDLSKPDGTMKKLLDNGRMQQLGWKPKVSFEEGLRRTFEWYINKS